MKKFGWQKYVMAFLITGAMFVTAFYISEKLTQEKLANLQATRDKIAIDILSTETQFSLLAEASCEAIGEAPVLSRELNSLARRLSLAEGNLSTNDEELIQLKEYYSLLLIKDYLLGQEIAEKCGKEPISILYFYSNEGDCPDCQKEGYVLTSLREAHPELRVYSFDTNLELSAISTLKSVFNLENTLPALVINGEDYYGFQSREKLESLLPKLDTETATSTKEQSGEAGATTSTLD